VLLEALEDFGGTLIFVSHDRYFVDRLATKVIDIGRGEAVVYPGNYEEFLWSKRQRAATDAPRAMADANRANTAVKTASLGKPEVSRAKRRPPPVAADSAKPPSYEDKKKADAEARRTKKDADARQRRIQELEARIANTETAIKELEAAMSAPGFYDDRD
jgi:ATP-binding cassette subfamily F protein 3